MDNGVAGLFDHIYLGRSIEDLDRASAEAFGKTPLKAALTQAEMGELWQDLAKADVKAASLATRKLVSGRKESVAYLSDVLRAKPADLDVKQVAAWIDDLDSEAFSTREKAQRALSMLGDRAIPHLQQAHARPRSGEQKNRLEALLKERGALDGGLTGERLRLLRAARVLEWAGSADSLQVLEALEKMPNAVALPEIKQARDRLARAVKR
jgi:hypothetical protein